MFDLNELSPEQIEKLDKDLSKYRKSVKDSRCYRVTFDIIANPKLTRREQWVSECLGDSAALAESLNQKLGNLLSDLYDLKPSEKVNIVSLDMSYL
jgi:hypothetical protein